MKKGIIKSFDNKQLAYYLLECDNPKFIVQIAHGMQEYSKVYFEFAQYLAEHNCIVFMFDERGHGKTAIDASELGKTDGDIFQQTVNDHIFISKMLKEKYNLPLILFGHSYGSFIAQAYVQECDLAEKIILSGSAYMKLPKIRLGKFLTSMLCKIYGKDKISKVIEKMTLKAYARRFKKDDGSWITSDKEETRKFYEDKLNGQPFSLGFYYYMFNNQLKLYDKQKLSKAKGNAKILIASGDKDAVGENGKLVKRLFETYKKYGYDAQMLLYKDLRHGIVQEKNRAKVFKDILNFIEK